MLLASFLLLLGLLMLIVGGELLVRGGTGIALLSKVSPAVVGVTVVAAGTSMPEMFIAVNASLQGSPGLAMGTIVGSNIFNIGMILGIASILRPLVIQGNTIKLEWPIMLLAAFELHLLSRDGVLDRLEGSFLLASMLAFTTYAVWIAQKNTTPIEDDELSAQASMPFAFRGSKAWLVCIGLIVGGSALLAGGSAVLVHGAGALARLAGVSTPIIGLTIVAAGTSLPELVTTIVALRRKRDDIAVGNVVGANIFNILAVGGLASLVSPMAVPAQLAMRDNWWMIGFTLLLFPVMRTGMRITRSEGIILLISFGLYLTTFFYL